MLNQTEKVAGLFLQPFLVKKVKTGAVSFLFIQPRSLTYFLIKTKLCPTEWLPKSAPMPDRKKLPLPGVS